MTSWLDVPTNERTEKFVRDFIALSKEEAELFTRVVLDDFVPAIDNGPPYPNGLRIKGIQGAKGVWEMTWQKDDGRATFEFGQQIRAGQPHIVWRRVGGHGIFSNP